MIYAVKNGACLGCAPTQEKLETMLIAAHISLDGVTYTTEKPVPQYNPDIPTKEEQIAELTAEYRQEKANLCEAYTTATMQGDTETAASVAADMADLDAWFDEEYKAIEEGSEA